MFNSTHTLVGLSLAWTGLDRIAPSAVWTALIATNLPDIDIVAELRSTADYLHYHRGITHSLIGLPILAAALALAMFLWKKESFTRHFVVALAVMSTHPALDYLNTYGVHPFSPFKNTWYYGDTLFVIDIYLDLILLAGAIVGWRLARRRRTAVGIALCLALGYIGFRIELRDMARAQLERYTSHLPGVVDSAVSPGILNPFILTGIVRTAAETRMVDVDVFKGVGAELVRVRNTSDTDSPASAAARQSRSGMILDRFARFPISRVEQSPSGYRVYLIDFRFFRPDTGGALAARIDLDRSFHVLNQAIAFTDPVSTEISPAQ